MNYDQWKLIAWDNNTSVANPFNVCIWDRQILLWPRPSTAAQTTTLGAAITTTTATSITVASSSGFNRGDYYRFIIDSEVIYATASTSTTFTGCLRGREGTTAATHSNAAGSATIASSAESGVVEADGSAQAVRARVAVTEVGVEVAAG